MEKLDIKLEDEIEQEEFSNFSDFLFFFLMSHWLKFDIPYSSLH